MDNSIKVTQTTKGKPAILKDGYFFTFSKNGVDKKIWVCDQIRCRKCPARLHTTDSLRNPELVAELGEHNHAANAIAVEVREAMSSIRQDALASTSNPAILIARNIRATSSAAQGAMPLSQNIKRKIRQVRGTIGGSLTIPHAREDIDLPHVFCTTENGEDFLLFDSGPSTSRILMFTTSQNLNFLKLSDVWLADGTFKVSPALFDQFFIIHGQRNKNTFPLAYCLTPNRLTATYTQIMNTLKDLCPGLAPNTIMCDFKLASRNAFAQAFPAAEMKDCYFHFNQSFYRNIQSRPEVLHMYSTDAEFSLMLRHLVALAFVPPEDVTATFEQLMNEPFFLQHEALLTEFIAYFETTWLGGWNRRRTARIPPRYAITLWNCFHSVLEDKPKTNNGCEGFHSGFSTLMGASHPTIYKFIQGLKDQQTLTELKINQFLAGTVPPPSQKKYLDSARRLKSNVEIYGAGD